MPEPDPSLRFVDVLTTSSAVTNFLGAPETTPGHVLSAIAVLMGEAAIEDLGRPVSPLARAGRGSPGVSPPLRELVQRWFQRLGGHGDIELTGEDLCSFKADLRSLEAGEPGA